MSFPASGCGPSSPAARNDITRKRTYFGQVKVTRLAAHACAPHPAGAKPARPAGLCQRARLAFASKRWRVWAESGYKL